MKKRPDRLIAYSRPRRGKHATGRWYYLEREAANGETLSSVRYASRAGRNQALRRVLEREPDCLVSRFGPEQVLRLDRDYRRRWGLPYPKKKKTTTNTPTP